MPSPSCAQESLADRQQRFAPCFEAIKKGLAAPDRQFLVNEKKLKWYSQDKSHHPAALPAAAVLPSTIEEVSAVVKACVAHKVPMTPRGAGTGLEGGAIPYAGGVVIDMENFTKMDFDVENACVWVGAGVKKMTLNKEAGKLGFIFGPDPASNPSVGGMVSTSGSGMSTLRYGTTRENVIALRVVTAEGAVVQTRQVVRKSSAGLELTQLYIGSEGTLGIVCEICFRLFPLTKYSAGGYANFPSTADAVRAVVALKQQGVPQTLLRCEMINATGIAATNAYSKMSLPESPTLLFEFTSSDPRLQDVKRDYKRVEKIFKNVGKAARVRYLKAGKEMDSVWSARRTCLFAAMRLRGGVEKVLVTDVCVPISRLTEVTSFTEKLFDDAGKKCLICAHIADGNFHLNIPFKDDAEMRELLKLEDQMIAKAIEMGGTVSGEHGIGVGKVHLVTQEHGQCHIDVQEKIKKALDKDNLMNPGAFYPFQRKKYCAAHL